MLDAAKSGRIPKSSDIRTYGTTPHGSANLRLAMGKLIKIVGVAVATVGLAALGQAPPAYASAAQDQEFYWLLTEPDQDTPMVIWDFPLVRSQGIAVCQREDAGETLYQALKDLQNPTGRTPSMSPTTSRLQPKPSTAPGTPILLCRMVE